MKREQDEVEQRPKRVTVDVDCSISCFDSCPRYGDAPVSLWTSCLSANSSGSRDVGLTGYSTP